MKKSPVQKALERKLLGRKAQRELCEFLTARLPRLETPTSRAEWKRRAARIRREVIGNFMRGHPAGVRDAMPKVEWTDTLETGKGYRIRKLRYEGYPGMWAPALLYEPDNLKGKAPVVLNPNGHHVGGKAMAYKQARCINMAKRGMIALNTEFIGMGELRADKEHSRIGHLDLCGIAGVGVFYLLMKRGLDVLLSHRHADHERVAMTGLSGGGWQTALLSALDERIKVIVPVAGHSPAWQRVKCAADIGDLEQLPSDLCAITDFDVLTAMFAPRPSLLIYNRHDDCCFQTRRTRLSIYRPAKAVYEFLGAADNLGFHDNVDPGTHNYELDNRTQLYKFLNRHFGLDAPDEELPWEDEIYTENELNVGLPEDNATLISLAGDALKKIRKQRAKRKPARSHVARRKLARILKLPDPDKVSVRFSSGRLKRGGCTICNHLLDVGGWSVPVVELTPGEVKGTVLVISKDGKGGNKKNRALQALEAGCRVFTADILGTGEASANWQYHMLLAATGQRALGLQVAQILALAQWCGRRVRRDGIVLNAQGPALSTAALIAAALKPERFVSLNTENLYISLGNLIEGVQPYEDQAMMFCFGLLEAFDMPDFLELAAPVPVADKQRGPLRL